MIKKTRVQINTSVAVYVKVFFSFLFGRGRKYEEIFKNNLKEFLHTDDLILTSQGRVAAYNIFKVIISNDKKEIIISPYTLTEVVKTIIYANAIPIFVDLDLNTGLPLENDLDKKINERTAGIVITHLYSNKEDIYNFKKKYEKKINIIEDVAINFGAKINDNKYLGTIFDYGFYSFGVMKNLCTFHGGAIICKNKLKFDQINKNLKLNINYPFIDSIKLLFFCIIIDFFYSKYVYKFFTNFFLKLTIKKLDKLMYPGVYPRIYKEKPNHYNFKFQNNFAIAGIENLKNIKTKINNRINNVKLYEKYLNKNVKINNYDYYNINSFLEYPILLKKNKNKFLSKVLLNKGYDIRHTWYVNSARFFKKDYKVENLPNCENLHENILSLPTHSKINELDIINITNLINFYEK